MAVNVTCSDGGRKPALHADDVTDDAAVGRLW